MLSQILSRFSPALWLLAFCGCVHGQVNTGYSPNYVGTGNGCKAGGTCYYVDYTAGSNTNNGLTKATAWKAAPGMACASGTAGSHTLARTDQIILKGGTTWPASCFPWTIANGGATTSNSSGYPGLYIGYDPTWNAGTVTSVRVVDPGSCAAGTSLSVMVSGGGGSGATATAKVETDLYAAGDLQYVTVTNAGSGYTSNPVVSFAVTTGSCAKLPTAYADIYSPVMDGSGTTFGNSSGISPMVTFTTQYGTIDHIEFKNYRWYSGSSYSGGSPTMLALWASNAEFRNLYVHQFGAAAGSTLTNLVGALNAAQTAATQGGGYGSYSTLTNCIFNNYEMEAMGCAAGNGNSGSCTHNVAIYNHQYVTNNIINAWRGGLYTQGDSSSGFLVAGNKMWAILSDPNSQHADAFYLLGGTIAYNNILRDIYPGAAAFYTETQTGSGLGLTTYLFNNVVFGIGSYGAGTSTPPVGWTSEFPVGGQPSPTPDMRAYNNTFYSNVGNTNCMNAGQWFGSSGSHTTGFTVANNHCVSSQSAGHWVQSGGYGTWNGVAGASLTTQLDNTAVVQSPTTATSQGYTAASGFAPTSASSATVTFANGPGSANLTGLCSTSVGGISLAPLCYDINGNPRPATGGWQAGAYHLSTSGIPAPPTNLIAIPR